MKNLQFTLIILFSATLFSLPAQESSLSDSLAEPTSSLILFGSIDLRKKGSPVKLRKTDSPIKKTMIIPKLELINLVQKRISFSMEIPTARNSSFILNLSRRTLNKATPRNAFNSYTESKKTTRVFLIPITTFSNSDRLDDWGDFLPTAAISILPKYRGYHGGKNLSSKFFFETGLDILFLNGLKIRNKTEFLNQTTTGSGNLLIGSTTTTKSYRETRIVSESDSEKRVTVGITIGMGYQINVGKRFLMDLSIDIKGTRNNGWHGLKGYSVIPQVQFGYRI